MILDYLQAESRFGIGSKSAAHWQVSGGLEWNAFKVLGWQILELSSDTKSSSTMNTNGSEFAPPAVGPALIDLEAWICFGGGRALLARARCWDGWRWGCFIMSPRGGGGREPKHHRPVAQAREFSPTNQVLQSMCPSLSFLVHSHTQVCQTWYSPKYCSITSADLLLKFFQH